MTRKQFRKNLIEALIHHDCDLTNEEIEKFLDLNYDEDSSLSDWTFSNFNSFAIDVCEEGLWRAACRLNDLHYEGEDDDEDDEPTIEYYEGTDDPIVTEEVYEYYYSKEGED